MYYPHQMKTVRLRMKDLPKLRRIALSAQGLNKTQAFGLGVSGAQKAIEHLGYVQIDTISVVERAHHHVFHSRVPDYRPEMLQKMLSDRNIFEYWAHAAAFLPISAYRYSLPYKAAIKSGKHHWYKNPDYDLMAKLMRRVEKDGPLRSRDIKEGTHQAGGWWNWKPAKRALEQLYFQGDLMVTERRGFQKAYDLAERVLPANTDTRMPSGKEYASYLLDQQLRCHGFVALKAITYQRRDPDLRKATKVEVDRRLANNELVRLVTPTNQQYLASVCLLDERTPRLTREVRILSPFDNSVIQRERLADLFGFDYQIECYVPEAKRKFGYFCLPILWGDRFVGRMDCKAHRAKNGLEVKSLHFEPWLFTETGHDLDEICRLLARSVERFASFQGLDQPVTVTKVVPATARAPIRKAFSTSK